MAALHIDHITRIITTIKAKGAKPEVIVKFIMRYAKKSLPADMGIELKGLRAYTGMVRMSCRMQERRKEGLDIRTKE